MTQPTANDMLMGGGSRSASWATKDDLGRYQTKPYGTSYTGTIEREPSTAQQTDYDSGALLTWPDGNPRMQVLVTLQTQLREDPEDNGIRTLVVKQSTGLQAAIRDAVKATGAKGLEVGGTLTVTLTGEQPSSKGNPIKVFSAQYQRPAQSAIMGGQQQQQQAQPQYQPAGYGPDGQPIAHSAVVAQAAMPAQPVQQTPVAQPVQPPAAQPAQQHAGPDPMDLAKRMLHELGMTPEQVAASTGLTLDQIKSIPPF